MKLRCYHFFRFYFKTLLKVRNQRWLKLNEKFNTERRESNCQGVALPPATSPPLSSPWVIILSWLLALKAGFLLSNRQSDTKGDLILPTDFKKKALYKEELQVSPCDSRTEKSEEGSLGHVWIKQMEEISPSVVMLALHAQFPVFYTRMGKRKKIYTILCFIHNIFYITTIYSLYIVYNI